MPCWNSLSVIVPVLSLSKSSIAAETSSSVTAGLTIWTHAFSSPAAILPLLSLSIIAKTEAAICAGVSGVVSGAIASQNSSKSIEPSPEGSI